MYAEFFGFRELPFNNTPDSRFFYSTPDHDEALASLIYAVQERKGFVLLTGEVGAGKTLVSRMMLRHFGARIAFASINHAVHDATDLMESLCTELEINTDSITTNAQYVRTLQDFLLSQFAHDTPVVLVLDEAQNLSTNVFEQLRMIGNLEADDAKLLQIVIVGQPELQAKFASRELRQLLQRVFRSFHLPALSRDHTEGYIRHRIAVAGGQSDDVFTERAVERIYEASHGLPRLINAICDNALLSAYSSQQKVVDIELVDSVIDQSFMIPEARDDQQDNATPQVERPAPPPRQRTVPAGNMTASPAAIHEAYTAKTVSNADPQKMLIDRTAIDSAIRHRWEHQVQIFDAHLNQKVKIASQQFQQVQKDVVLTPHLLNQARIAGAALLPLVERSHQLIERGDELVKNLDQQHDKGRALERNIKTLVTNAKNVLANCRQLAIRIRTEEATASRTLKRLTALTCQSQRLSDAIDKARSDNATAAKETPAIVAERATPAAEVTGGETLSNHQGPRSWDSVNRSRRTLDELRALVGTGSGTHSTPAAPEGTPLPADVAVLPNA
ncbi:MAG: ExeA family protein [Planctomycetota bacterium]